MGLTFNEDKLAAGDVALVVTHLGIVWNFTNTREPTVSLTADKTAANITLIDTALEHGPHIPWSLLLKLVGNLMNASYVVERGRIYCCGVLATVRSGGRQLQNVPKRPHPSKKRRKDPTGDSQMVDLLPWGLANLRWWRRYFSLANAPPKRFLLPRPTYPGVVQSDASGLGFGGVFASGKTLLVFHGRWTDTEKALIDSGKLDINLTEMLTSYWLITLAAKYLTGYVATIDCDNLQTVQLLHRQRSRRRSSALLLERIDLLLAQHQLRMHWQHLPGKLNVLSDRASRECVDELDMTFFSIANATFPLLTIKDISAALGNRRQTHWLLQAL